MNAIGTMISSLAILYCLLLSPALAAPAKPVAFPGAEGAGRFATGGRGGSVAAVTNLHDSGPGSLRDAISVGHRTIVFHVAGTIELESDLVITQSRMTIAGQTAPGGGICLKGYPLKIKGADNIIIRHLRVRPGDEAGLRHDGIEVRGSRNVIIDHCSISWTVDEAINTWHGCSNLTVQWCMIVEPLNRSVHRGAHGYGASWGGKDCSYHHNLFAHCAGRNPSIAGQEEDRTINMDHRCSVIFNWEHRSCDGKPEGVNVVNNYYKPGPATLTRVQRRIARIDDTEADYGYKSYWYIDGNVVEGFPSISEDNWKGGVDFLGNASEAENRRRTPFPSEPVTTQSAEDAYELVLRHAGATLPRRDAQDERIVREVRTGKPSVGTGIIDSPEQVGGWPELKPGIAPPDSDKDGMPDEWERRHGFNPADPSDGSGDADQDGYTNLEEFLNDESDALAISNG